VKRRELIKKIEEAGGVLIRHGGKHGWYQNPETKVCQPVPRQRDQGTSRSQYLAKTVG